MSIKCINSPSNRGDKRHIVITIDHLIWVEAGGGNDYLPWLYTQPLQHIGGANVCIVLGK
jgi:hypothetical protein